MTHGYTDSSGDDTFTNLTGTLTSSDRDSDDTPTYASLVAAPPVSPALMSRKSAPLERSISIRRRGAYKFVPLDSAIEALTTPQTITFDLTATDESSVSATQVLTINLNGTNDIARHHRYRHRQRDGRRHADDGKPADRS